MWAIGAQYKLEITYYTWQDACPYHIGLRMLGTNYKFWCNYQSTYGTVCTYKHNITYILYRNMCKSDVYNVAIVNI